jgi:hypothetical protein
MVDLIPFLRAICPIVRRSVLLSGVIERSKDTVISTIRSCASLTVCRPNIPVNDCISVVFRTVTVIQIQYHLTENGPYKSLRQRLPAVIQNGGMGEGRDVRYVYKYEIHPKGAGLLLLTKPLQHGPKVAARTTFLWKAKGFVDESHCKQRCSDALATIRYWLHV